MTERLLDAVASLRYKQIECLVGSGVDINSRNARGQTALMIACFLSQEDKRYRMFRFLMKHNADILDLDDNDTSVFQYACMRGCLDIVEIILKKASVAAVNLASTDKDGRTALFYAVTNGNVQIVTLLVSLMRERGISVDTADISGRTPLLQATMLGNTEIALILEVEGRANPRICDREMHMDANGWAEDSARKQQTMAEECAEVEKIQELIFPNLSGSNRRDAMKKQRSKWQERPPSLPMISYRDITNMAINENNNYELPSISETKPYKSRKGTKMTQLNNKSFDSALSLLELSRKSSLSNMRLQNVGSIDVSEQSSYDTSSNYTINKLLGFCSDQSTGCYRKAAQPPKPRVPAPFPVKSSFAKDRFLTLATLAKVLPSENAQGLRFLSVRTNSRGGQKPGNASPSAEGSETGEPESTSPSPNPETGSMWKRLRKKSMGMGAGDSGCGDEAGGAGAGGGSLLSRLKKSKNNVPHIVTTHAR
ncbi:uncharacterized protein [Amphiura filiformis]|uniref:uncharacterized protein n=1 Tax=Amphiura filiformis TaxID=82378 RepID=UPI003B21369D